MDYGLEKNCSLAVSFYIFGVEGLIMRLWNRIYLEQFIAQFGVFFNLETM